MKGNRFYSIPYDARNDPKMKLLRRKCGGIAAFGRWQALLGILYDEDARIDLSDQTMHEVIEAELELKGAKLDDFIDVLAEVGWVDRGFWEAERHVVSASVYEQLHYKEVRSSSGKKGGRGNKRGGKPADPDSGEGDSQGECESKA